MRREGRSLPEHGVVTNGLFFVGTRYVTDPKEEPLTLYHSEGSRYVVEDGVTRMFAPEDDDQAVLSFPRSLPMMLTGR